MHLILIGMPAAGKTTLGQKLAAHLSLPFTDLDWEVEKRAGGPVRDLWAAEGEAAFRALEAETLEDALAEAPQVIATGGGTPMQPGAMDRMLAAGLVVYLETDLDTALARLAADGESRPLLKGDARQTWPRVLAEREATYRRAHLVCRDGERLVEAVGGLMRQGQGGELV